MVECYLLIVLTNYIIVVGGVVFANLYTDEKNNSRGFGTVEFNRAEFAQKAVDIMNSYAINGRRLFVKKVCILV